MEMGTTEGDSPVSDMGPDFLGKLPKYHGTREILWEAGRTIFQG